MVPGAEGDGELSANGYRVSLGGDEEFLKLDCGDDCPDL